MLLISSTFHNLFRIGNALLAIKLGAAGQKILRRPIGFFYTLLALIVFYPTPLISQDNPFPEREKLANISDWSELCEVTDCRQFPVGYSTYAFGPELYYFPTMKTMTVKPPDVLSGGVKPGRFFETNEDGDLLRSVSISGGTIIANCCHHLLTFYGLADAMPMFRESPDGNRMPAAWTVITSFDRPRLKEATRLRLGYGDKLIPSIRDLVGESQLSYNDDFWLISFGEQSKSGIRMFEVLSKRPLLNGHYVYGRCSTACFFRTLRLEETVDEVRPHVSLRDMRLTGENMFLCSSEELAKGCDPAPENFDQVTVMLELVEQMFEAAAVFPEREIK